MFNRNKSISSLERFIYKHLGYTESSAYLLSNIIGVLIDVKPSAQCDWPLLKSDIKTLWLLKQKLESLKLVVIFGENESSFKVFYVAKSHKRAELIKKAFENLHDKGASAEIHTEIGKLLGYPDTAVQYYIRLHPEKGMSDNHRAMIIRNRFYAHSLSHEDEEFDSYEKPIYRYLSRHCPRTAKLYQKNAEKRWLD
ncbi:MAG: hypothetical protein MJ154_03065 [Candidatus Saccharibacteria bacterium]|nr:hypothetical protein [Candidatus Saccharibacteria bacterium]